MVSGHFKSEAVWTEATTSHCLTICFLRRKMCFILFPLIFNSKQNSWLRHLWLVSDWNGKWREGISSQSLLATHAPTSPTYMPSQTHTLTLNYNFKVNRQIDKSIRYKGQTPYASGPSVRLIWVSPGFIIESFMHWNPLSPWSWAKQDSRSLCALEPLGNLLKSCGAWDSIPPSQNPAHRAIQWDSPREEEEADTIFFKGSPGDSSVCPGLRCAVAL